MALETAMMLTALAVVFGVLGVVAFVALITWLMSRNKPLRRETTAGPYTGPHGRERGR